MLSVSPVKVATPATACTDSVPPRVALAGLFASASVTKPVYVVSTLPPLSVAETLRLNGVPAVMVGAGRPVLSTASCVAAAPETVKGLVVAVARLPLEKMSV